MAENVLQRINLLDTSVSSLNLGDNIIVDSIKKELHTLFKNSFFTNVATHDSFGETGRELVADSEFSLLLGSNILSSKFKLFGKDHWDLKPRHYSVLKNKVVLCGVGWRRHNIPTNQAQKWAYKRLFSKAHFHAVRDSPTAERLDAIGVPNVLNTACPTMWKLVPGFCKTITAEKSKEVVFTLTKHKSDVELDAMLVRRLKECYDKVYFWPQQIGDLEYLSELNTGLTGMELLPATLEAFDHILEQPAIEYVGTRLHGGIRSLQHGRRTLIISVDYRAEHISQDTNLPVINRTEVSSLEVILSKSRPTEIRLPQGNIDKWKGQF